MSDLSDLRRQVSSDIKDTVSQITQTNNTRELVEQMKEVCVCVCVCMCMRARARACAHAPCVCVCACASMGFVTQ